MLSVFVPTASSLKKIDGLSADALPADAIWIDLKSPVPGEDKAVERLVGIEIPTREDMQEMEASSRLYIEHGARYMTATLMCAADSQAPRTTPVTFILAGHRLVTVRYDEPRPFALVLPGGWAPDKLRRYAVVKDLIAKVHAQGKIIGIICHGGLLAISAKIIHGGHATGSLGIKDDLENAGATWVDQPAFREGNLVWGRVVADIPAFNKELVAALLENA